MKRLALTILLAIDRAIVAFSGLCQKIIVGKFEQQQFNSPVEFVKSLNGDKCALILIHFRVSNISVDGNVVQLDKSKEGEFSLWVAPGTKMIRILSLIHI